LVGDSPLAEMRRWIYGLGILAALAVITSGWFLGEL